MDSVLSSLGTLINNIKNLTLPGLVAAFAFAILLWPPQPIDVVTDAGVNPPYKENWPTTKSGFAALANLERRAKAGKAAEDEPVAWKNEDFGPVCWTKTLVLPQPQSLSENKPVAVVNQYELERIQRQLQDCADRETALSGAEQGLILDITAELGVLTVERDGIRDTYLGYEKSANPLRREFLKELQEKEDDIRVKQREIHEEEQLQRERARRSAELTRLSKEVSDRLLEPGRLRPLQKFDDFLASLGSHVVAFLSLALGWSLLFDPINKAVFGYFYEVSFDDQLDYARGDRKPLFVYAGTKTSPTILWMLPALVGLLGVFLLVWSTKSKTATSDFCSLSPGLDCASVAPTPRMLAWLVACLVATVAGLGLAILVTGWLAHRRWNQSEGNSDAKLVTEGKSPLKADDLGGKAQLADLVLRRQVADSIKKPQEDPKAAEQKKKEEDAKLSCLAKLTEGWEKIRQPEFAIGQGLLSRDEYNSIRDEYYAQSLISVGLVLPVMLLTFAIVVTPQLGLGGDRGPKIFMWLFLVLTETALIMIGADRRNKFEVEVETRISGQFLKTCEAAKKPATDPAKPPSTTDLIRTELKNAKIVGISGYKIEPGDDSTTTTAPTTPQC